MAAKIAGLPEPRDRSSPVAPKAKKARLVQADDALELDDDQLAMNRDLSDILTVERYIPADPTITRMREIMDDPAGHFLPSLKQGGDSMFYVGPRDLAPELEELFTFPSNILRKRQDQSQLDERQVKRARTDGEEEDEVPVEDDIEAGRRQSVLPSEGNFGLGGDDGYVGGDQTFDDIQPGFEDSGPSMEAEKRRMRTPSVAPSVTETIARQIQDERSTGTHDLAMFEKDARDEAQSQSQVLTTPTKSVASDPISKTSSGYSKNTGMAMGLLRREIEAIEAADKAVGFDKLADKVSLPFGTFEPLGAC
jgi:cohesin complex subunit SCC1